MRAILTMALKDLRLMSRDWLGMFFIIGFPIAMSIFFGTVMGSMGGDDSPPLRVAVVDEDESPASNQFVEELKAGGKVEIEDLSREMAIDRVRTGKVVGMIALPRGFGESAGLMWMEPPAIELGVDPSRKAEAGMLQGNIMQAMGKLMFSRFQDPSSMSKSIGLAKEQIAGADDMSAPMKLALGQLMDSLDGWQKTWEETEAANAAENANTDDGKTAENDGGPQFQLARIETIDVTHKAEKGSREELFSRIRSKWDISFPQAIVWGILACAAGFAISIVRERQHGTLLRLQVAPVSRAQLVAGKATACFLAVIGVIGVMVVLGVWLGMRPVSYALLTLAAVCIAFCFVGIMMLMSVIGKTEEAVSGAAWGANMLMAMFGGGMIPLLFMPAFMRTLSNASPVKWSVLAMEGAIWRGFTLSEMLLPCGILLAVGAVCLAIGTTVLSRATN
jgi:linearmycin/streptolysin S transport system permease protein